MKTFYPAMDADERETTRVQRETLDNTINGFNQLWNQTKFLISNENISDTVAYNLLYALSDSLEDIEKAREAIATIKRNPI